MGTRNLTAVIHEGKHVIAQYGQWDGYPEGQGETARAFLAETFNRDRFLQALKRVRWITKEETDAAYKEAGSDGSGWVTMDVVARFDKIMPFISRDHGAEILELVQESTGDVLLGDSYDFAADGLMCEWAYVIDLDKNTFEVYKGFTHEPLAAGERFAEMPARKPCSDGSQYYPVKHVVTFPLDAIPSKQEFRDAIRQALPKDEEEAA